jgi:hypothetical protein
MDVAHDQTHCKTRASQELTVRLLLVFGLIFIGLQTSLTDARFTPLLCRNAVKHTFGKLGMVTPAFRMGTASRIGAAIGLPAQRA